VTRGPVRSGVFGALLAWATAAILFSAAAADAPGDSPAGFRLVESRNAETLERDLAAAAAEGYRVLGAAQARTVDGKPRLVAVLERIPGADEPYEYAVLAPQGHLEDPVARRALSALGAGGYRIAAGNILARKIDDWWLPQTTYAAQLTLILERPAAPERYAYDSVRLNDVDAFHQRLAERRREGYEVLALVNSGRRVRAVLGKSLDAATPAESNVRPYRLLSNAIRPGMKHALKRAAAEGYRVVAATDQSINAPAMLLLDKRADPPDTYAYRVLSNPVKKHRKGKLERRLDRLAARGFRVVPGGITDTALALERAPGERRSWRYRILSSRRPPGLPRALEEATRSGYRFVAVFANAVETVVLVERGDRPPV
jgi:hypothetical protein